MSVALLGLVALQVYWVRTALDLKERQFSLSVQAGLQSIVSRLEAREARATVTSMLSSDDPQAEPATQVDATAPVSQASAAAPVIAPVTAPAAARPSPAPTARASQPTKPQSAAAPSARITGTFPSGPVEVTHFFMPPNPAEAGSIGFTMSINTEADDNQMAVNEAEASRQQLEQMRVLLERRGELLNERRQELDERKQDFINEQRQLLFQKPKPNSSQEEWNDWQESVRDQQIVLQQWNQENAAWRAEWSAHQAKRRGLDNMRETLRKARQQPKRSTTADQQYATALEGMDRALEQAFEAQAWGYTTPPTPPVPPQGNQPKRSASIRTVQRRALSLADSICNETETKLLHQKRAQLAKLKAELSRLSAPRTNRDGQQIFVVTTDSGRLRLSAPPPPTYTEADFSLPVNGEFAITPWKATPAAAARMYRAAELNATAQATASARSALVTKDRNKTEDELSKLYTKVHHMRRMVNELLYNPRPVPTRVDTGELQHLLRAEFDARGISTPFVMTLQQGKPVMHLASSQSPALGQDSYSAELFPSDVLPQHYHLVLHFPRQTSHIYQSTGRNLVVSAAFILIICFTFAFTVRTILHQKKLSEMKTDFINNMTHEFKTPIATISLASEALHEPSVHTSDEKRNRFMGMIQSENKRLQSQVERVLQMAEIERGTIRLNTCRVDAGATLDESVQKIAMQVEKRGGSITQRKLARNTQVMADPMHLCNIFTNLLDNANKYSRETPQITVTTANAGGSLRITVEDNGIGMSEAQQRRIFESFYRVPTGNLHDVKGFGLGLAYVKTMVQAHGGTVEVRSEPGRGSRFEVILPIIGAPRGHSLSSPV